MRASFKYGTGRREAALSLQKECVLKNRLFVNRDTCGDPIRPLGQAGEVSSSEIKPDRPLLGRLTFVEDFTQEHSSSILHIASIEISGIF